MILCISILSVVQFNSVTQSCPTFLQPHGLQHNRPPCPSPTPRVYSNLCPLSWSCHPAISSYVVPFSSLFQSFPASESFKMSQFFTSGGQSIWVSAWTSVLPMSIQDWFPLGWSGWIFLQSKGLSSAWWTMDGGSCHCTGDRDQDYPQQKEMEKGKMVVWGGLKNSWEKK